MRPLSSITPRRSNGYRTPRIRRLTSADALRSDPRAYNNRASAYHKLLAMPEALEDAEEAIKIDPSFIKAYIRKALTQQTMKELSGSLETLQKATEMDVEKKVGNLETGSGCFSYQFTPSCSPICSIPENSRAIWRKSWQNCNRSEQVNQTRRHISGRCVIPMWRKSWVSCFLHLLSCLADLYEADPLMRQILQDSQQDPRALMDHMKNPMVRTHHRVGSKLIHRPQIAQKIQKLINAGIIKTR